MRAPSLLLPFFAACALTPASNSTPPPPPPAPPKPAVSVFVSPSGNDAAIGSKELPYKTLARALSREDATDVVIAAGEYAEKELVVARKIALVGPAEGGAVLAGRLIIRADEVVVDHLDVTTGIAIERARGVVIDAAKVGAGGQPSTIAVTASRATIGEVEMRCGEETCLEIVSSTTSLSRVWLFGEESTKRGLRAVTSSVTASDLEVTGTQINQILAGRRTRMTIRGAKLSGALGSALAIVDEAEVHVERLTVEGAAKFALLVQSSKLTMIKATLGATKSLIAGISGGKLDCTDCDLEAAPDGAISVGAHLSRLSEVRLVRGTVRHGRKPGALVSRGTLTVAGTRFIGDVTAKTEDGDAIIADSVDALLAIQSAQIETPAGFGVTMTNGASGSITATITKPRSGGIYVDGVAGAEVKIESSRIEACVTGSGIAVQDSTDVRITQTVVIGCPEAGILAGLGANLDVERSRLVNNKEYGVAAFGRAVIELGRSKISNSRWATFASCGDGARIEDAGNNRLLGQTTACP